MADKKIKFEFEFEVKEAMKGNADFNKGLKESVDIIRQYNDFANKLPKGLQDSSNAVKGFLSALETAKKVQLANYNELIGKLNELESREKLNASRGYTALNTQKLQTKAVAEYNKELQKWDSNARKVLENEAKAIQASGVKVKTYEQQVKTMEKIDRDREGRREEARRLEIQAVRGTLSNAPLPNRETYMNALVADSMRLARQRNVGNMTAGISARPLGQLADFETTLRASIAAQRAASQERVQLIIAEEARVEAVRQAGRARELAELQQALREQHALRLTAFDRNLQEQNARMRYGIALEHAQHVNNENTLQGRIHVARVRWAERTRQLEQELATQILNIRERINQGNLSAAQGAYAVERAQMQFAAAVRTGNRALVEQERALASVTERHRNFFTRIAEVIGIYGLYHTAINLVSTALKSVPTAGLEQQTTESSLFGIFGTEKGRENIEFIKQIANEAGQGIVTLEQAYRRFAPAAILAGGKQEDVNKSFKDFAELGTILHLPADKMNSIFNALDQMYDKRVVQSEELKRQLGQVLPGAVEIAAKAMEMQPDKFMESMKKNEILAKEFVPKFAKLYREIFGGPDDSVFKLVKDRLMSNTAKLGNDYIELSRSLFARTQETLNTLVKQAASALETVTSNLQGTLQVLTLATEALFLRLGIVVAANIGTITTKLVAFYTLLTGLSLPVTALAGTLVLLTGRLAGLGVEYNKTTGFVVTYREQQVGLVNFINTYAIMAVNELTKSFDNLHTSLNSLTDNKIGGILGSLLPSEQDFKEFSAFTKAIQQLSEQQGMRSPKTLEELYKANLDAVNSQPSFLSKVVEKAQEQDIETLISSFNNKSALLVSEAIAAGRLTTDEQITRALANTVDIPAPAMTPDGDNPETLDPKKFKDIYKSLNRDVQQETKILEGELQKLENLYKNNGISIAAYYEQAIAKAQESKQRQLNFIADQRTLADQAKDAAKASELEDRTISIDETIEQRKTELRQKEIEDNKKLQAAIDQVNLKYYERMGMTEAFEKLQIKVNDQEKINFLLVNAKGNKEAANAAQRYKDTLAYENNLKKITAAEAVSQLAQQRATVKEEQIQRDVTLGLKTQLQGMLELINVRKAYVAELEKQLTVENSIGSQNPRDQARILQLQQQIDAIKYEGAGAAQAMANSALPSFLTDYQGQEARLTRGLSAESGQALGAANKALMADPYADHLAIWEKYQKDKHDIEATYSAMSEANNMQLYSGIAGMASTSFGTIADAATKAYGAQSTAARLAFGLSKAAAIAEITMSTAALAIELAKNNAKIPLIGMSMSTLGPPMAYAMGAVQLASVMATAMPQAHAGLTDVPSDQTYLLKQGERVLAPEQNKDLKMFLKDRPLMQKQAAVVQASNQPVVVKPSIKVINVHYDDDFERYLTSSKGEEVVVNHMRRANA